MPPTCLYGFVVLANARDSALHKVSMYYSFDKLFSINGWLIAMIIGGRGVGKTFNAKVAVLKRFLKTGEQFIYLRRYKTELDSALYTFWDDLQANDYFKDHVLKVQKNKMITKFTCDGEVCGYAIPLSTANILKSTAFPLVKTIVFDEFILDVASGTYKYMRNEPEMLLDVIETVGRLRDIQVLMLGNNVNFYGSPYTAYWNLELPYQSDFRTFKDGLIVVNYIRNEEYQARKKVTKFGRLIDDTTYGDYAIENKSLRESSNFIAKRPSDCRFQGLLIVNGINIGVWVSSEGICYLSEKYDPNTALKFACDYDDHSEQTVFLNARDNPLLKIVIRCWRNSWLRFENPKVKTAGLSLLNKCLAI